MMSQSPPVGLPSTAQQFTPAAPGGFGPTINQRPVQTQSIAAAPPEAALGRFAGALPQLPPEAPGGRLTQFAQSGLPQQFPEPRTMIADGGPAAIQDNYAKSGPLVTPEQSQRYGVTGPIEPPSANGGVKVGDLASMLQQPQAGQGRVVQGMPPPVPPAGSQPPNQFTKGMNKAVEMMAQNGQSSGRVDENGNPVKPTQTASKGLFDAKSLGKAMQASGSRYAEAMNGPDSIPSVIPQQKPAQPPPYRAPGRMRRFTSAFPIDQSQT